MSKTWQIEGHLLSESIFANSSTDIQRWKRKKAILLSSFLSRKIKLLKPTIDGLTEELLTYVRVSNLTSAKTKQLRKVAIDSLVFPWLVYSMLALIFDIEMPKYNVFLQQNDLCSALVDSCRRFIHANNQMHQSPLLCLVPSLNRLVNFHLLNKPNLKQIQSVINEAIRYRLDNGLLGLSDCSKRPSKRSVKFRDEVYSSLIAKGKTDVSNDNDNDDTECTNHRPQSPRAQLKELTFIDIILNYEIEPEDKLEGYDLSRPELLDNLTAFFTVSLSTLSKTISGILFYLALYPGEQSKVRQEVIDCVGVRDNINWESLRNLKYTEAFLKEVLRLNPPIERIERVVTKSCNLESNQRQYKLSPGMLCSVLVSAVHQDPEYYPEPNAFRPSRFYDQEQTPESPGFEKPNVNSSKFLAFGLGSRTCIGLKFVMFYLKHLIANVLLEYELQMPQQSIKCYLGKQVPLNHILNCKIQLIARTKTTRKNN